MQTAQNSQERTVHFLVFELDGQFYGVNVDQTEGIVEGQCCEGMWSYEGQEVPVHCLARWVGLEQPAEAPTRVLLTRSSGALQGFLVDTPQDIVALALEDIFALPILIRQALGPTPLWGVGRMAEGLLLLVDLAYGEETP